MATMTLNDCRQWTLGELVGAGGTGKVYAATTPGEQQLHVIKLVPQSQVAYREIEIAEILGSRPFIVPVLAVGQFEEQWALLMPRADLSLRQHIETAHGPILEDQALPILIDLAQALSSIMGVHLPEQPSESVVHRDLKPENVLFLRNRWCLSDFGIARDTSAETAEDTRRYGMTPQYGAPEQWTGETATAETDVYAFGVIAFELLMGSRPFTGSNLRQEHLTSKIPPMPGVSRPLATIVSECLYKQAGTRPLPDELLKRLKRLITPAASPTAGIAALQEANLAETIRIGDVAWQKQQESTMAERRLSLFHIAGLQWLEISSALKEAIVQHAPRVHSVDVPDAGWQIQINDVAITFSGIYEEGLAPLPEDGSTGNLLAQSEHLPFDVVAHCHIAVGRYAAKSGEAIGWSHSLWFCDAHKEGRYGWYETAFTPPVRPYGSIDHGPGYIWAPWGSWLGGLYHPSAAHSSSKTAITALMPQRNLRLAIGESPSRIMWPFTPLNLGELDDFIDRWVTWLAGSSQGNFPHFPVDLTQSPKFSWRMPPAQAAQLTNQFADQAGEHQEKSKRDALSVGAAQILQEIDYGLDGGATDQTVAAIAIAPHLSTSERAGVCRELRAILGVRQASSLKFKYLADKKDRPPGMVGGPAGWIMAYFLPLRFLDRTPYEELIFISENSRVLWVERRARSKSGKRGRVFCAFVVIASELAGAFRNGSLSPSVRAWFDGPEMMLMPESASPTVPPWTAERAREASDNVMRDAGIDPSFTKPPPLFPGKTNPPLLAPGAGPPVILRPVIPRSTGNRRGRGVRGAEPPPPPDANGYHAPI